MSAFIADTRVRYIFCFVILTVSLFLLGAGRVGGEKKALSKRARNVESCRETAQMYINALPAGQQEAWNELVRKNPELAVRSGTLRLHEIRSGR